MRSLRLARKAEQLNAVIIAEFVEPGESAKSARRKALQDMLDYIGAHEVKYCITNKVDGLARNRLDDAIIHATLREAGVTLVSVTENIDETPSGMLMHGIKAPIGYLNVRTTDPKGHKVRDIGIDPDRADHVRFAFTAYATADWSLGTLARELETRGLTTRATPSFPAKPVTTTLLHKRGSHAKPSTPASASPTTNNSAHASQSRSPPSSAKHTRKAAMEVGLSD